MAREQHFRPLAVALAVCLAAAAAWAPASLAADVSDIGFVDQTALSSMPAFLAANRQLATYKNSLDKQFAHRIRSVHDGNLQARIAQEFQNRLADRQRGLFGPLFARAQVAIASVASTRNLSVIVDKHIVIYGGQDVTRNVIDLLSGPGDPIPPVNTPPPSEVGFVDQTQLDQIPKIRSANEEFQKYQADQQAQAQTKLKGARSDGDRQQILKDYQQNLAAKQKQVIAPLVDLTRDAIAAAAKKKGLLLVIDRTNLVFGGTDLTSDVTSALK
jgi:outer membrane protein